MARDIPGFTLLTSIRSALVAATPSGKNGKPTLPLLAAFAAHNAQCQVAVPGKPAAIQPSRASSPNKNVKSG